MHLSSRATAVVRIVAVTIVLSVAPVAFSAGSGVTANDCSAQTKIQSGGVCCYQQSALCNDGTDHNNSYYLETGSCP